MALYRLVYKVLIDLVGVSSGEGADGSEDSKIFMLIGELIVSDWNQFRLPTTGFIGVDIEGVVESIEDDGGDVVGLDSA